MLKFKEYLLEKTNARYNNDYQVGDVVFINYWLSGDMTPVKLIEKKSGAFIVSHKVKNSSFFNAPDHVIKIGDIVGRYQGIDSPQFSTDNRLNNPSFDPEVAGDIPKGASKDAYPSNDIAF